MSTSTDLAGLVTSVGVADGFWQMGILWTPLISTDQTRGAYSIMEQLMPSAAGPPPHIHDHSDETFYILEGEIAMQLGDQVITGTAGQLVRIPAGMAHAFAVVSDTARVLNFYVPGDLDLWVSALAVPASSPTLPPPGLTSTATAEQEAAFSERLHDLATQRMADQADLLGAHRGQEVDPGHMP